MKRRSIAGMVVVVTGAVLVPVACSPPVVGNTDATVACSDYAYAYCNKLVTCSPTLLVERYPDLRTCFNLQNDNCVNAIGSSTGGATALAREGCSQALPGWDCDDFLFYNNPPPSCTLLTGTATNGNACGFDSQCQSGFCQITPGSLCGACQPALSPGAPCTNLVSCALVALFCSGTTGQCTAHSTVGQACDSLHDCVNGLGCVMGVCQNGVSVPGATCISPPNGPGCDLRVGLECNGMTGTCAPVQLAGYGQPCGFLSEEEVPCAAGGTCIDGVCTVLGAEGAECDVIAGGSGCISPARCVLDSDSGTRGTCQIPNGTLCQ
jgi:hypothetical protein